MLNQRCKRLQLAVDSTVDATRYALRRRGVADEAKNEDLLH